MADERAAFEAWFLKEWAGAATTERAYTGAYQSHVANDCWEAWQAWQAALNSRAQGGEREKVIEECARFVEQHMAVPYSDDSIRIEPIPEEYAGEVKAAKALAAAPDPVKP